MSKTIIQEFREILLDILKELGINETNIPIESNKSESNGQFSTTVALAFAKKLGEKPLNLAQKIAEKLTINPKIKQVAIAGPGFLNVTFKPKVVSQVIGQVLTDKNLYGQGEKKNFKISLEEVSVNPTGFLHLAHARNAVIGDSLFRILTFNGYDVETEYYVNDAGNQINLLALTVFINYLNQLGKNVSLPEQAYRGEGYDVLAKEIIKEHDKEFLETKYDDNQILDKEVNKYFRSVSIKYFLDEIKKSLAQLDVKIDEYISEATLYPKINSVLDEYQRKQATYEHDDALFLKTKQFGDDKDRVLVKKDGTYTYLTSDLVNHNLRIKRTKADKLINVWGGDHHGYIARLRAGLEWMGNDPSILEIEMIQMVRVLKDGQEFKMSKRKGTAVWLVDILEIVGKDALRYMLVSKAATSHMDLDLDLVKQKNAANPVYYAQYATARLNSILIQAKEQKLVANTNPTNLLTKKKELELLICLDNFTETVNNAAKNRSPNIITDYIQKVATYFHSYYSEFKVIDLNNQPLTEARLGLVQATLQVLHNALTLIGVNVVEEM